MYVGRYFERLGIGISFIWMWVDILKELVSCPVCNRANIFATSLKRASLFSPGEVVENRGDEEVSVDRVSHATKRSGNTSRLKWVCSSVFITFKLNPVVDVLFIVASLR